MLQQLRSRRALVQHEEGVPEVAQCAAGGLCRLNQPVLAGDKAYEIPRGGGVVELVHRECFPAFAAEELAAVLVEAAVPVQE